MADAGAESLDLGLAADDAGGLAARLDAALQAGAHVLVTSGGVSMGARSTHGSLCRTLQRADAYMQATATW